MNGSSQPLHRRKSPLANGARTPDRLCASTGLCKGSNGSGGAHATDFGGRDMGSSAWASDWALNQVVGPMWEVEDGAGSAARIASAAAGACAAGVGGRGRAAKGRATALSAIAPCEQERRGRADWCVDGRRERACWRLRRQAETAAAARARARTCGANSAGASGWCSPRGEASVGGWRSTVVGERGGRGGPGVAGGRLRYRALRGGGEGRRARELGFCRRERGAPVERALGRLDEGRRPQAHRDGRRGRLAVGAVLERDNVFARAERLAAGRRAAGAACGRR